MALFSIVTVTYENISGLERTARSVREQSCCDYEWIVIDGGSIDGTKEFLQAQQGCQWISEPDHGIYDAMNKAIDRVTGAYTIFMNAGDIFANKEALQGIVNAMQNKVQDIDFIYGDALEGGKYKTARSDSEVDWGMFTHHQAMFYKTERLKAHRYDSNLNIAADYDLTCRFLRGGSRALYIPLPICDFEPGGLSQQQARLGRRQQYDIRKRLGMCSPYKNILIYMTQMIFCTLKILFPNMYWKIRS